MSSMNVGVARLLFNEIKNLTGKEIFGKHLIIHQERIFKKNMESEYGDVVYDTEIRWFNV